MIDDEEDPFKHKPIAPINKPARKNNKRPKPVVMSEDAIQDSESEEPLKIADVKKTIEQEDEPEDFDDLTMTIGVPTSEFSPSELTYIGERESEILDRIGKNNKSARPLVNQVIQCDIQIRRMDLEIVKIRRKYKSDLIKMASELKAPTQMRAEHMENMMEGMRNLHIMPKDCMQADPAAVSMSELHSRYRRELDARRAVGQNPGSLTGEAAKLCIDIGSIPEQYSSPRAMPDAERQKIISETEEPS